MGGIGVLSLFATIAATTSKKVHAYDNCMAAKGYRTAAAPGAPRSAAQPSAGAPKAGAKPVKTMRPG